MKFLVAIQKTERNKSHIEPQTTAQTVLFERPPHLLSPDGIITTAPFLRATTAHMGQTSPQATIRRVSPALRSTCGRRASDAPEGTYLTLPTFGCRVSCQQHHRARRGARAGPTRVAEHLLPFPGLRVFGVVRALGAGLLSALTAIVFGCAASTPRKPMNAPNDWGAGWSCR